MNYFQNCKNLDDAKAKYRELAKEHHPDRGGDTKKMQDINLQYDEIKKRLKNGSYQNPKSHDTYTGGGFADFMEAFKRHQAKQEAYRREQEVSRKKREAEANKKREEDLRRQAKNAEKEKEDLFSRFKSPPSGKKSNKGDSSQMGLF